MLASLSSSFLPTLNIIILSVIPQKGGIQIGGGPCCFRAVFRRADTQPLGMDCRAFRVIGGRVTSEAVLESALHRSYFKASRATGNRTPGGREQNKGPPGYIFRTLELFLASYREFRSFFWPKSAYFGRIWFGHSVEIVRNHGIWAIFSQIGTQFYRNRAEKSPVGKGGLKGRTLLNDAYVLALRASFCASPKLAPNGRFITTRKYYPRPGCES